MSAPLEVTTKNLAGVFLHNKSLSGATDEILKLQGVSWIKRKAIATFNLTLYITHTPPAAADDGVERIHVDQKLSGGIPGTAEHHVLDWEERRETDDIFGVTVGKARRVKLDEVEDEFLRSGWTQDTVEDGVIEVVAWSDTAVTGKEWRAEQISGFEQKNGARRYCTRIKFTSSERSKGPILVHMYYDYQGPNK
ncbi:hypothetical protein CONPUDRAFT_159948 [Coniophora puteana RWD-64-598 SS2]|uniref:LCCL domain-containing protein n=1 Tax=Coniophora puteana (strain RWD-64-598) TaxID=741705 RepID=R7SFY9_CONPW|nr:uncharacterized protein CONPUDRAFT_159948 [Coniophora puteana RWD-64-598 SS2]EIW74657.1 hypothetical protein CONPUDRAFT_159948 [Coniophora puteana RWD-64-598 SS2]